MAIPIVAQISEQYESLKEQYTIMRMAMAPLRLSRWKLMQLMIQQVWRDMSPLARGTVMTLSAVLVLLVVNHFVEKFQSLRRLGIPVLERPKGRGKYDYQPMMEEGARKYPNSPYLITYSGYEYVVYPSECFDEVKRLPAKQASALEFFTYVFFQKWRFLGSDASTLLKTISVDLARGVPVKVHSRQDDARRACESAIGPCPEWNAFPLYWTVQEIVATTNATGLVGQELGTDRRWLKAVQRFPMAVMIAVFVSNAVPKLIRPIVSFFAFFPAWMLYWYMKSLLRPMVREDIREYEATKDKSKLLRASADRKLPFTAWLMSRYRPEERNEDQVLQDIIVSSFESTPSTAGTLYFILAELVTRPDLVEELREELHEVMKDGKLPLTHLGELKKMDSAMRESSRTNPFSYLVLYRRLKTPVQLSIGPQLPAGSLICVDAHHIHNSETLWKDHPTHDPMRFYRMRQQPGHEDRHQFTSLGSDSPGWGDGAQACPGRMFGGNTLKIILADILLNYDISLRPGDGKPKRFSMPNASMAPEMNAKIMFRQRRK